MESAERALARQMYDEYCTQVGGLAFNGDPLPDSTEFFSDASKRKQSNAWIACAVLAINNLNK